MQPVSRGFPLNRLLVYCYFCPDAKHRPGGVQQIISPLLLSLARSYGWDITVVHPGFCHASPSHFTILEQNTGSEPDSINPTVLSDIALKVRELATKHDLVLSIDRLLPGPLPRPCVLMSNTLGYLTEAVAVQGAQWALIVVPTERFARAVSSVNLAARVCIVPYGLSEKLIRAALTSPPSVWGNGPLKVRLPHRPDQRKGHRQAIEGLARALPRSSNVRLEISWLDEIRYLPYREELVRLANHFGVSSQVHFYSWLNGSDRWRAITDSCAVLQLGDYEESFGLSIIESILFGKPAITQRQDAIREVVGGLGLLLEIPNPLDWYEALEAYYSDQHKEIHNLAGRQILAQSLSIERMTAHYDRILSEEIHGS